MLRTNEQVDSDIDLAFFEIERLEEKAENLNAMIQDLWTYINTHQMTKPKELSDIEQRKV